jgi:hypothetical protein
MQVANWVKLFDKLMPHALGLAGFRGYSSHQLRKGVGGTQISGATFFRTGGPASHARSSTSIQKAQLSFGLQY